MNRIILCLAVAVAALAPARVALGDDKPTKEQLEQAKAAFGEGKALHDQGKLTEAVEKFKESYRLSKNPLLLYNIGLTLDEAGQKDNALLYYRKFLSDAPANAGQRATANERVKVLEKEKLEADLNGTGKTEPVKTEPVKTEPVKPTKIKPAGTYSATDFQHQSVDGAPPGKPLDVTAFVPEDSGWTVTLYYRDAGAAAFQSKPMKWRYKELVARIPAAAMKGNTVQYYVEVKDQAGTVVTRAGKSTNPNLISIDPTASARFYPDMTDDGTAVAAPVVSSGSEDEDPLHPKKAQPTRVAQLPHEETPTPSGPETPGESMTDVGSKKFGYAKWTTTTLAVTMIGVGVATYVMAGNQASNLVNDTKMCGAPPCRSFDAYDTDVQNAGKNYQTISNYTLALGVVSAGVASYFWYKQWTSKKKNTDMRPGGASAPSPEVLVTPAIGDHFGGAAATVRW